MENFNEQGARAFIGKEADYYLKKWQPILEGRGRWAGFNWTAFFLTGLWLAYRKMYKKSFIFYGMILIGFILEEVFFVGVLEKQKYLVVLDKLYPIILSVICGAFGNIWYLSLTRKVIYEFRSRGLKEEAYFQSLSKRGGTNVKNSLGLFILFLLAAIIVGMAIELFPLLGMLFCNH